MTDFLDLGTKVTADGDCSHEIKRHLLLGRNATTNLDSILESRDINLPTNVCLVKASFSVVMYGCELNHKEEEKLFTLMRLCDPMTYQVPLRQEYWSESLFPSPEVLLDLGIKPRSPALQADT